MKPKRDDSKRLIGWYDSRKETSPVLVNENTKEIQN
jgi:hypothetical protein